MPKSKTEKSVVEDAINGDQGLFDLAHNIGVAEATGDTAMKEALFKQLQSELEKKGITI